MTISTATRYVVIVIHRLSPLRTYRHMSVPVDQCLHHTVVWVKEPHTHLVPVPIPFVGPASTAALSQMRTCCGTMHWQWLDSFVLFAGQASRSLVPTQADPRPSLCICVWIYAYKFEKYRICGSCPPNAERKSGENDDKVTENMGGVGVPNLWFPGV